MADAIRTLLDGGTVEVEGCLFVMDGDGRPRAAGEWYIGQRNGPPRLLTVKSFSHYDPVTRSSDAVDELAPNEWASWINPVENAYPFNYGECVLVREADTPAPTSEPSP